MAADAGLKMAMSAESSDDGRLGVWIGTLAGFGRGGLAPLREPGD